MVVVLYSDQFDFVTFWTFNLCYFSFFKRFNNRCNLFKKWKVVSKDNVLCENVNIFIRFLIHFQARNWISNVICCGPFLMISELRWKVIARFVDNGGMIDHLCLKFLFKAFFGHCALRIWFMDSDYPFGIFKLFLWHFDTHVQTTCIAASFH